MSLSIWHLLPGMRARSRWIEKVERTAADCLPGVWPHITSPVKSMPWNEAYGYLRAHASLHVTQRIGAVDLRLTEAVIERLVQLLEQRVHQRQPAYAVRRAA